MAKMPNRRPSPSFPRRWPDMRVSVVVGLGIFAFTTTVAAQTNAPAAKPVAVTTVADASLPVAPDEYAYKPDGRRDPFLSLAAAGTELHVSTRRGDGPAAFMVGE